MSRRAFLFDFDGTLVDTMGGFADIAGSIIHDFHPDISIDEGRRRYLDTSGIPFFQQLEVMFPGDPKNVEKAGIFEELKKDGFFKAEFSSEVVDAIKEIRSRGDIAGVASNNFQELIDEFISRKPIEFDIVLGFSEGFAKGKVHFEFIMNKFSLAKNDLTFIGDSLNDAQKALDFGIRFIGLCGTFSRKDFLKINGGILTVESISEILKL